MSRDELTDRVRHVEGFPPESTSLQGDQDHYPVVCPECECHVRSPHSHRKHCKHWGEVTDPRVEDGDPR